MQMPMNPFLMKKLTIFSEQTTIQERMAMFMLIKTQENLLKMYLLVLMNQNCFT